MHYFYLYVINGNLLNKSNFQVGRGKYKDNETYNYGYCIVYLKYNIFLLPDTIRCHIKVVYDIYNVSCTIHLYITGTFLYAIDGYPWMKMMVV